MGYRTKGQKASWNLESELTISDAAELYNSAKKLLENDKIKTVQLGLPEAGIAVPTYQVLKAFEAACTQKGVGLEVTGTFAPYGGQAW